MSRRSDSNGPGAPSLDLLRTEMRWEQEAQLRHFEALDAKAGIVLGFAGALVAIAPAGRHPFIDLGRFAAAASAVVALSAFWPRQIWITNVRELRDIHLDAEPRFTSLRLLDTQVRVIEVVRTNLKSKARRLRAAMTSLSLAAVMTAVAVALH